MKGQQSGWGGTPIKLRTNAPRQTQEDYLIDDDENEDAWAVAKPHTSAVKYPLPPSQ